jgi:hypothetical protein
MTIKRAKNKSNDFQVLDGYALIDVSTRGLINKFSIIDIDDLDKVINGFKWIAHAESTNTYVDQRFNGKYQQLHRFLLSAPQEKDVDHINGNTLDNRKSNLRLCTKHENQRNRRLGKNNTSGFKGVTKSRKESWKANIYIHGRQTYLGSFSTPELAALAYDEAANKHYGDFAKTNMDLGLLCPKTLRAA